jgi:hypothetical protein
MREYAARGRIDHIEAGGGIHQLAVDEQGIGGIEIGHGGDIGWLRAGW